MARFYQSFPVSLSASYAFRCNLPRLSLQRSSKSKRYRAHDKTNMEETLVTDGVAEGSSSSSNLTGSPGLGSFNTTVIIPSLTYIHYIYLEI